MHLETVHCTNDLVKVPAGGGWVQQRQLEGLVRSNHEHGSEDGDIVVVSGEDLELSTNLHKVSQRIFADHTTNGL